MEHQAKNTALLVMDINVGILSTFNSAAALIKNIADAVKNARDKNIPVIYVTLGFRQGAPEISTNNKGFTTNREKFAAVNMDDFMKIEAPLTPIKGDITVVKRRVSAFSGSDLEMVLRAQDIKHIILSGIATSGVVLSTVREAADKDYQITVLADCCADRDDEVHHLLTTKVFPRQAEVLTLQEWNKQ